MASTWMDQLNAQLYEEYAQTYPMYRNLGKKLIEVAEIQPGQTVVDLACGTGIVTAQLQEQLHDQGKIIGVDMSHAMLDIAREKLPTVEFIQTRAEDLPECIPAFSADVVACNSAFWQMDPEKTLLAIKQILKPGGHFIFNLSESDRKPDQSASINLHRIMWHIAVEEYNYVHPQPSPTRPKPLFTTGTPFEVAHAFLKTAPLTLQSYDETIEIEHTAESTYAFNKIPIMTEWLHGLEYPTRREIVDKAYQQLDKNYRSFILWRFYTLANVD